ncbi:hypothetical protein BDQ17DRAFT_1351388 [Cyathus striatus]|nr:hypothetical protein BDQ17DRAFT_1351388 [Cyathus striatus]
MQERNASAPPSDTLVLLGVNASSEADLQSLLSGLKATNVVFKPSRAETAFVDFEDANTAAEALKVAEAETSITEVKQIKSRPNNSNSSLMVVGSNLFAKDRTLPVFSNFKVMGARSRIQREPYAVVKFDSVEAAVAAQEKLNKTSSVRKADFQKPLAQ